jgi:hypothetical protein
MQPQMRRVDIDTPEGAEIGDPYDFQSIFGNLDDEDSDKKFNPYGRYFNQGGMVYVDENGNIVQYGQVEDENDMLLRILGEM